MIDKNAKVYIAGHRGLVGSALIRTFQKEGFTNLVTRTHVELDLCDQAKVKAFFEEEKPEYVVLAAAKVGGILANRDYPADFIADNLVIQTNVIDAAYKNDVKKFIFLGSSCIYPKLAPQPMPEDCLLTSALEPTNEPYAIAKIAGLKMCSAYRRQYGWDAISLMPTNLYGPEDNFDLENSHVLPALLRRFHEAKEKGSDEVILWGSGTPKREFLHVDDLAAATLFLLGKDTGDVDLFNVGCGEDISIAELAGIIAKTVGYTGDIGQDISKPDGTPRKLLDVSRLKSFGWKPAISLEQGIADVYEWYLDNQKTVKGAA